MFSIVHVSGPRFGGEADLDKIASLLNLLPDIEPSIIVVSGDLTMRARHGEFQAARVWIQELERSAPTYVIPGDGDVQWWSRPLFPGARAAQYSNYAQYFGPVLAPTLTCQGAIIAGVHTARGVTWPGLTSNPRDPGSKGHVDRADVTRVAHVFRDADPDLARIVVMHHNILRGGASGEMGVARWKQVHRWLMDCRPDLILCGHDVQQKADVMGGIVVSCAGAIATRGDGKVPSAFHRLRVDGGAVQIEPYEWDADRRVFKRGDMRAFARLRVSDASAVTVGVV